MPFCCLRKCRYFCRPNRDVAQPGSAHVWGACGRWFESSRPDKQKEAVSIQNEAAFLISKSTTFRQGNYIRD